MFDDGEIKNIPLDTPIDVESADSFTSINDLRLTHNRQKYQGGTLPSSVRFEHNGFACGWDVYRFSIQPTRKKIGDYWIARKRISNNGVYEIYVFNTDEATESPLVKYKLLKDTYIRKYNVARNVSLSNENVSSTQVYGEYTAIDGMHKQFMLTFDRDNGEIYSLNDLVHNASVNNNLTISGTNIENNSATIEITDNTNVIDVANIHMDLPGTVVNDIYTIALFDDLIYDDTYSGGYKYALAYKGNMINIDLNYIIGYDGTISNINYSIASVNNDIIEKSKSVSLLNNMLAIDYIAYYIMNFIFNNDIHKVIVYIENITNVSNNKVCTDAYDGLVKLYIQNYTYKYGHQDGPTRDININNINAQVIYQEDSGNRLINFDNNTKGITLKVQKNVLNSIIIYSESCPLLISEIRGLVTIPHYAKMLNDQASRTIKLNLLADFNLQSKSCVLYSIDIPLPEDFVVYDCPIIGHFKMYPRVNGTLNYDDIALELDNLDYKNGGSNYDDPRTITGNEFSFDNSKGTRYGGYKHVNFKPLTTCSIPTASSYEEHAGGEIYYDAYNLQNMAHYDLYPYSFAYNFKFSVYDIEHEQTLCYTNCVTYINVSNIVDQKFYSEYFAQYGHAPYQDDILMYFYSKVIRPIIGTSYIKDGLRITIYNIRPYDADDDSSEYTRVDDGSASTGTVDVIRQHAKLPLHEVLTFYRQNINKSQYPYVGLAVVSNRYRTTKLSNDHILINYSTNKFEYFTNYYSLYLYDNNIGTSNIKNMTLCLISTESSTTGLPLSSYRNDVFNNLLNYVASDFSNGTKNDDVIYNVNSVYSAPTDIGLKTLNRDFVGRTTPVDNLSEHIIYGSMAALSYMEFDTYNFEITPVKHLDEFVDISYFNISSDNETISALLNNIKYDNGIVTFNIDISSSGSLSVGDLIYYFPQQQFSSTIQTNPYTSAHYYIPPFYFNNDPYNFETVFDKNDSDDLLLSCVSTSNEEATISFTLKGDANTLDVLDNVTIEQSSTFNYENSTFFIEKYPVLKSSKVTNISQPLFNYNIIHGGSGSQIIYIDILGQTVQLLYTINNAYSNIANMVALYDGTTTVDYIMLDAYTKIELDYSGFGYSMDVTIENVLRFVKLKITNELNYTLIVPIYRPDVYMSADIKLISYDGNNIVINKQVNNNVDYDIVIDIQNKLAHCDEIGYSQPMSSNCFIQNGVYNTLEITNANKLTLFVRMLITLYLRSILENTYDCVDKLFIDSIRLNIDGDTPTLQDSEVFDKSLKNYFIESYVDTTEDVNVPKEYDIQKVNTDELFTYVRQQWDTSTDVLCFWWLDDEHILKLTNTEFILERKTSYLDAWLGNKFTKVELPEGFAKRSNILDSDVTYYNCSSCYNSSKALFFTISVEVNRQLTLSVYDFIDHIAYSPINIDINYVSIDSVLNNSNKKINTYSDIDAFTLASKSNISSTIIDNKLIIGIHYDNNYNQWAIIFNINNSSIVLDKIIQGYGYVAVNGDLTGGEIPTKYFDVNKGFNNTVHSLKYLNTEPKYIDSINELYNLTECVVGDGLTQWYIAKNLDGVVSHLTYSTDNHSYSIVEIPISNNYDASYASPSFISYVHGDQGLYFKTLQSLIPGSNAIWTAALAIFGYPIIYYVAPKFSKMIYLQQTGGQTAYVHFNSTDAVNSITKQNKQEDVTQDTSAANVQYAYLQSTDSIIFDTKFIKQTSKSSATLYEDFFLLLANMSLSALSFVKPSLQAEFNNADNNADVTAKFTWGKSDTSYSSILAANLESSRASNFKVQGFNTSEISEITMAKSLDMFYSTSVNQKICAGAGYVNHNFIAQCITQSFSSTQINMTQQKVTFIISALTMFQIESEYLVVSYAAELMKQTCGAYSGNEFVGFASSYTMPLKVGALVLYGIAQAAKKVLQVSMDCLPTILNALGGNQVKSTVPAIITPLAKPYDYEPKHRYGSKIEMFMYPCDIGDTKNTYTDETVSACCENKPWHLDSPTSDTGITLAGAITAEFTQPDFVTISKSDKKNIKDIARKFEGDIPFYTFKVKGTHTDRQLPDNMSMIQGVSTFLPEEPYRNKTVSDTNPVFSTPIIHDYIIDKRWKLSQTATNDNGILWISSADIKLIDGAPSNVVVSNDFCGIASTYCALEIKNQIDEDYIRPAIITPNVLSVNISKYNALYNRKAYNGFDGVGYRLRSWVGEPAMITNKRMYLYSFIANNRFKRSNKLPPLEILGNFKSVPDVSNISTENEDTYILRSINTTDANNLYDGVVIGEDVSTRRYSIPIFSEQLTTLPAQIKTIESYPLAIYDGITSLCTDIRNTQAKYKVPMSVDFNINKNLYRYTKEYICSVQQKNGVIILEQLVPVEGLTFLGATPYEAFFYSKSNRLYYIYQGGTSIQAVDMIERFRNVKLGRYDFIEQSVVMECLADMSRIDSHISDEHDETDNVFIANLKNSTFDSEVSPPNTTIFNEESWFKVYSLPSGIVFQGPNRCHIHRHIPSAYMFKQIKANLGKWQRIPKEYFHPFRVYPENYIAVNEPVTDGVVGWTHNPFVFVTSMLGVDIHDDCKFEWEITFTWTDEMDAIYSENNFACVNIMAETITQGGKVQCRPTHIYLTKELFSRSGNQGYYSFRFQSNNGIGNRERLFIWSDAYIAINEVLLNYKVITQQRTSKLTQQVDIQQLSEL